MKGVVFNIVEEFVTEQWSADDWDYLMDAAGLDGAYTALGTYTDAELAALVDAAAARFGLTTEQVLRAVGRHAFAGLDRRYPDFAKGHVGIDTFLPTVNDIIHPEVLKLLPGATLPTFRVDHLADGSMTMTYWSPRDLCVFAEGLVLGAGDHFGQDLTVHQSSCRLRGDTECVLVVSPPHPDGA
jgi:hypothetical protein